MCILPDGSNPSYATIPVFFLSRRFLSSDSFSTSSPTLVQIATLSSRVNLEQAKAAGVTGIYTSGSSEICSRSTERLALESLFKCHMHGFPPLTFTITLNDIKNQ